MLISVVVCTYNRSRLLGSVLETLAAQSLAESEYEVVVVDNNSSDDTAGVVAEYAQRKGNIRYVFEPEQGLSHARNRGWRESVGEYVAYTDDDCRIPPDWLRVAKETIERERPGIFGGPYFAFYGGSKPVWFKDDYGSQVLSPLARPLYDDEFLAGGNLFVRRSLLLDLGGFSPALGMAGESVGYGEETEFQIRVRKTRLGVHIYYEPGLFVYHLVRPEKMRVMWAVRAAFPKGRDVFSVTGSREAGRAGAMVALARAAKLLFCLVWDATVGVLSRDRRLYQFPQNYLYEHTPRYLHSLGRLYSQVRRIPARRSSAVVQLVDREVGELGLDTSSK